MAHIRQYALITIFILLCVAVIIAGSLLNVSSDRFSHEVQQAEAAGDISYFQTVNYYVVRNNKRALHLDAKDLTINSATGKTFFVAPEGTMFDKEEKPTDYRGDKGVFYKKSNHLILEGKVVLNDASSEIKADKTFYKIDEDEFLAEGNVKSKTVSQKNGDQLFIDAQTMLSYPKKEQAFYETNVRGKLLRKLPYEEGIYFQADRLESLLNISEIHLFGNVYLKKQDVRSWALRGEIFLENYNKKLKYFALYDDVKVVENITLKGGETVERKAFSEKLEGIMSEEKYILTGYPKVIQQGDVIKGNKIVLRENNEVVEVDDANTNFILK